MNRPRPIPLTFYTKPGCHLCEDVADLLEALSARWPLAIDAIDITSDLALHQQFWDKIPVVIVGDRTLQAPIEPQMLQRAVIDAAEQA